MEAASESVRWDDKLSIIGALVVAQKRKRYVVDYGRLRESGYSPVDEISPFSGEIIWNIEPEDGYQWQQSQQWAAERRIKKLTAEDKKHKRDREYTWASGAVIALRRMRQTPELICLSKHVRAYRRGVTIFAKEKSLYEVAFSHEAVTTPLVVQGRYIDFAYATIASC